jgi:hypothetical protein
MEGDDSELSLPELKSDLVLEKKAGLSEKKRKRHSIFTGKKKWGKM